VEPLDQQIWAALEQKGLTAVKSSLNPDGELIKLHLVVLPFSGSPRSWTLLETPSADPKKHWKAQKVLWERSEDYAPFADPIGKLRFRLKDAPPLEPTLQRLSVSLEFMFIENWLERLSQVQIPLKTESFLGLDGTTFELKLGGFWNALKLRWWCDSPESWQPLHALIRELLEVLGDSYDA
jgi:hypothetical protein